MDKQSININFSQGLDTKTDPRQVTFDKFLNINNSVFRVGKRFTKRNGFQYLSSAPVTNTATYLTTIGGNLSAIGDSIYAYNESNKTWLSKGSYQPLSLSVLPIIRNSINQTQCDSVVAPNGLVCTAYTENSGVMIKYKYVIADSVTGQNIISPTEIPPGTGAITGSPRVFLLGNYFIVAFTNLIGGTFHLQYIAININSPAMSTSNAELSTSYTPSSRVAWDGVVVGRNLYVGFNTTSGGQAIRVTILSEAAAALGQNTGVFNNFSGFSATIMSLCADTTVSNPAIYISFYENTGTASTSTGYVASIDVNLVTLLSPTLVISSLTLFVGNLASAAQNGFCSLFYEVDGAYGYDSAIPTYHIDKATIAADGTFTALRSVRSVGLASKAFIVNGSIYFLAAYQSSAVGSAGYQPTYFLMNGSLSTQANPIVVAKVAYENGGGYLSTGLPSVTTQGNVASIAYLFKDLIEAQAPAGLQSINLQAPQVYSQTGINLVSFTIGNVDIDAIEPNNTLQISGGFGWMYDGYLPVEENFFLWPDSCEATISTASITPTGTVTSGSNVITAVSSTAGLGIGMAVTGTGIPANQTVTSLTSATITFGPLTATSSHSAETITLAGNIGPQPDGTTNTNAYYVQFIYEWTDNQGYTYRSAPSIPVAITTTGTGKTGTYIFTYNVPTLRLTYKIANAVKILAYRWSAANPVYYQVTSIQYPTLNLTTSDYVTIVDPLNDSSIVGNDIIYTTGGVLENVNSPASTVVTTFDTRAWKIDSENPSTGWYSKPLVQGAAVEWSDLQTVYIAPNIGTIGQAGPVLATAPMDDKICFFHGGVIDYMNGTGPDSTGANSQYSQPTFITSTVGCSNQRSIVLMQNGLMFQASNGKGIWLLGRDLSTQYIGAAVERFNSATVTSAVNVPSDNQVRFMLDTGVCLVYDYYYSQWGTFTGLGGLPTTSSCIYQSLHTFINSAGQVYQENPGVYLDGSTPVLRNFTTAWLSLAGLQGYQRAYQFFLLGEYISPHLLNMSIAYNFNPSASQVTLINPESSFSSADPSSFGSPTPYGGPTPNEPERIFLAQQRCTSIQLSLQEVFDPSLGTAPGEGFTMSGIKLVYGIKKGWPTISSGKSWGGGTNRG